jgi:hypothetical protein
MMKILIIKKIVIYILNHIFIYWFYFRNYKYKLNYQIHGLLGHLWKNIYNFTNVGLSKKMKSSLYRIFNYQN